MTSFSRLDATFVASSASEDDDDGPTPFDLNATFKPSRASFGTGFGSPVGSQRGVAFRSPLASDNKLNMHKHLSSAALGERRHSSFQLMRTGSIAGHQAADEVQQLRERVTELEIVIARHESAAADSKSRDEQLNALEIEAAVAKRNCDILTRNTETLKALATELAGQLDDAHVRIQTLEDKLGASAVKQQLDGSAAVDKLRSEYEGRLASMRAALSAAEASSKESMTKMLAWEELQDKRVQTLEHQKDATILQLLRENETLKTALQGGAAQSFHHEHGNALTKSAVSTSDAKDILRTFRNSRAGVPTSSGIGRRIAAPNVPADLVATPGREYPYREATATRSTPTAAALPAHVEGTMKGPTSGNSVLVLNLMRRDLIAADASVNSPERLRRTAALQGHFPPAPQLNIPKYFADISANPKAVRILSDMEFDSAIRAQAVPSEKKAWCFQLCPEKAHEDDKRFIRIAIELSI